MEGPVSKLSAIAGRRITTSSSAARRLGQRHHHSTATWQATQAPTLRTPAGSAAARGCVKTPNSPIAFPLRPQEPGEHTRIAPTSWFPQCHSWAGAPQARVFTQSGELLCGLHRQAVGRCATVPHPQTPLRLIATRRRLTSQAGPLGHPPASLLPPHFAGATHANSTWQATPLSVD